MYVEEGPLQNSGKVLPSLQGKFYPYNLRQCSPMAKIGQKHLLQGLAAFRKNVATLKMLRKIENDSELWRIVSRKVAGAPSRKTVNNAIQGRHDAQISTLEAIAEALDAPLWLLFLPNLEDSDLQSPNKERIVALIENYLQCDSDGRNHTEGMASAFAAKQLKKQA